MPQHLHYHTLFRGPTVTITDVRCRPGDCSCGPEEYSDTTTVVFPRSGAFVRHIGRQAVLGNCNHVLFFRGRETYRVSHPVCRGDDCTSLMYDATILATEHFQKQLALADIARAVHYSPYHLARLFRGRVGEPIHRYPNRLRPGAALDRLAEGAGDLTNPGLQMGFSSHSHFSATFCREFGTPPSALRRPAGLRELSKNLKAATSARRLGC